MSIDLNSIEMLTYLHDLANNPLPNIDFTYTNPNIEITTTLIKIKEDAQEIIVEEYKLNCAKKF